MMINLWTEVLGRIPGKVYKTRANFYFLSNNHSLTDSTIELEFDAFNSMVPDSNSLSKVPRAWRSGNVTLNFIYFRLGKKIMPRHYDITVQIDVTHEKFWGHETIEVGI